MAEGTQILQGASQPGSARRGDLLKTVRPVIIVLAAGVLAILGVRLLPPLGILEANLADRVRIAMAAPGAAQDPRISVIAIDEATMATLPYRSPVDRGLLADLVGIAGAAGARAIGRLAATGETGARGLHATLPQARVAGLRRCGAGLGRAGPPRSHVPGACITTSSRPARCRLARGPAIHVTVEDALGLHRHLG